MGEEGLPLIRKWESTGKLIYEGEHPSGYKLQQYWDLLEEELKPKANTIISIIELWSKQSRQGSTPLNEWITKIYNLVGLCAYGVSEDRVIRDVLIMGCNSTKAKDKIIREGEAVSLARVIEILQTEEATSRTLQTMDATTKSIHYARYDKKKSGSKGGKKKGGKGPTSSPSTPTHASPTVKLCFRCGKPWNKEHNKICPAKSAKCGYCGQTGHYAKCCKQAGNFPGKKKSVHLAEIANEEFYDEDGHLKHRAQSHMLSTRKGRKEFLVEFDIGKDLDSINKKLVLKIDTGSDVNAINWKTYKELFPDVQLQRSSSILENFDATCVSPVGSFKCLLRWKSRKYRIDMEVMKQTDTPNVLSRQTSIIMELIKPCFMTRDVQDEVSQASIPKSQDQVEKPRSQSQVSQQPLRNETTQVQQLRSDTQVVRPKSATSGTSLTKEDVLQGYSDVFEGLGRFPGEHYRLRLKPDSQPARHRPRKVPVHLEEAFHEEVARLVKIDVLEPVTEPTEWVNSYVIVEKEVKTDSGNSHGPGHIIKRKLRLCLNPKDLNTALEREPYYCRSIDELVTKFYGAKVFTIVDLDKGYWQVELHPESRKYTCMALDIGRFQWKRLPMGTIIASEVFQRKLDSIFLGMQGVTGIADDMVIYGKTEEEHDKNLIHFLETARKNNIKLNKEKVQFKREVSFFGHQ